MGSRIPTSLCQVPLFNKLFNACFVPGTLVIVAGGTVFEVTDDSLQRLAENAMEWDSIPPKLLTSDLAPAMALVAVGAIMVREPGERERRKLSLHLPRKARRARPTVREFDRLHATLRQEDLTPEVEMHDEAARDLLIDQALSHWRERDACESARTAAIEALRDELPRHVEPRPSGSRAKYKAMRADADNKQPREHVRPRRVMNGVETDTPDVFELDDHATVAEITFARRSRRLGAIGVALAILFCWFGLPALRNATPTQPDA